MKKEKLKRIAKRITAFAAAVAMAAAFTFPAQVGDGYFRSFGNAIVASAETVGGFTISATDGGTLTAGDDYSYDAVNGVLTILSVTPITISGTTTDTIVVKKDIDANITLENVYINVSGTGDIDSNTTGSAAFEIESDSAGNVTIDLVGGNTLKSGCKCAGLQKNGTYTSTLGKLTIKSTSGTGKLTATGGYKSAGIGGGWMRDGSNIEISAGTVTATGGDWGAGIGGGLMRDGSNITITGGTVTANGGKYGAGIGGGRENDDSRNITISGGTVIANGGDSGAGIGGGLAGCGSIITITGGTVTANGGYSGAGIGGAGAGDGSDIKISGGSVTAIGGDYSAGIGGGSGGEGSSIKISGGSVKAEAGINGNDIGGGYNSTYGAVTPTADGSNYVYLLKIENSTGADIKINNTDYPKSHTYYDTDTSDFFTEKKIYVYLPAKTETDPNEVTLGDSTTGWYYDTANKVWKNNVVATPTASPSSGTYTENQSVELSCTTEGAVIYYTTDGTDPTTSSTQYTTPISVTGTPEESVTTPIKAIAVKSGMKDSSVATFTYTIKLGSVATSDFTVMGGTEGEDYSYANNVLTIKTAVPLTIANTDPTTPTTDKILVKKDIDANITLAGVNINVSATNSACAFKIEDDSKGNVTIDLKGDNTLKSGAYCAGLQKNGAYISASEGKLTIKGTGTLTAIGGSQGAGIGGKSTGSNITISGGTVNATGGEYGAGIGGGYRGHGSYITISGGTVNATGKVSSSDRDGGAGIGGGHYGDGSYIKITGGNVTATGGVTDVTVGRSGAGIGGGGNGDGSYIEIIDGTVIATGGSQGAGIGGGMGYQGTKGNGSHITIKGGNVTATGGNNGAGIGAGNNGNCSDIIISGGTVTASGGGCGAGIGGGSAHLYESGGNCSGINISGGTVTATGGNGGAGIGGGYIGDGSNITIRGGNVTAIGGTYGAGIGGGYCYNISTPKGQGSNITISGGSVYAKGSKGYNDYKGADIGCGVTCYLSSGNAIYTDGVPVTPTDGTNNVYLREIDNPDGADIKINNVDYPKAHTYYDTSSSAFVTEKKIYAYLPAKTLQSPNNVLVGETAKDCFYDEANTKWINVAYVPAADTTTYSYTGSEQTYGIPEHDYYTLTNNKQTDAGTYTVTVSLTDKTNTVWSNGTTTNQTYTFTIGKKDATTIADINESYNWAATGEKTVTVSGIPDDMGTLGAITAQITSDDDNILTADPASFDSNSGKVSYTLNTNTAGKIGSTATIKVTIPSQNYKDITFNVIVTITDKNARTEKPDCTLTLTCDSSNNYTATITPVTGAQYSFDGTTWDDTNTKSVNHAETVTGYIRYKETDEYNASDYNSDSKTAGHGTLTHHDAVPATCTADGYIEYWSCDDCVKNFSDSEGLNVIDNDDDLIDPATDHNWSTTWEKDTTHHWHKCLNTGCNEIKDKAEHSSNAPATETTDEVCKDCGYVMSTATGHIHKNHLTPVTEVPETCTTDGVKAHYECDCGKLFADAQAATEVTLASLKILAHHSYGTEWESDNDDDHYHVCSVCGDKTDITAHSYDSGVITTEPTEQTTGIKTYTCSECNHTKTEIVPKLDHTHSLATEYSSDATGHWYACSGCDEKLDFAVHTYGKWKITVPATPDVNGKKERSCTVCGYVQEGTVIYGGDESTGNIDNGTDPNTNALHADLELTDEEIIEKIPLTLEELEAIENGADLTVYMVVIDYSAKVPAEEKALAESILTGDMQIGMYIDVTLFVKVGDNDPRAVTNTNGDLKITFEMPEKLINTDKDITREYSIIRVHSGEAAILDCAYNSATGKGSFKTDKFSSYAIAYKDITAEEPAPEPTPVVVRYPIIVRGNVSVDNTSAAAGETVNVRTNFGYDIIVTAENGRQIAKMTEKGSFTMPASKVYVTAVQNETFALMATAWRNSYVYSYDVDMNKIKVSSTKKRGVIVIDLGEEYAGKSFTIYNGRKSTKVKITEGEFDENGKFVFEVPDGRNYTLVVED